MSPVQDRLPRSGATEPEEEPLKLGLLTVADLGGLTERLVGDDRAFWGRVLLATVRERWLDRLLPGGQPAPLLLGARLGAGGKGGLQGVVMALPDNGNGSCWSVHRLCLAESLESPSRRAVALALVRRVIALAPKARCWFARCWCRDALRLPLLREAGFQPLLQRSVWRLEPAAAAAWRCTAAVPTGYERLLWERSRSTALLRLENAATPTQLRHLLERGGRELERATVGGVLLESGTGELAAALRFHRRHPRLPPGLSVVVHPGHERLYGPPLQAELARLLAMAPRLGVGPAGNGWRLRCNQGEYGRRQWLAAAGWECLGDELLLARSIWRRQVRPTRNRLRQWLGEAPRPLVPRGRPVPEMSRDAGRG